eukprot:TRINITY_DN56228_c0_g1_i1.p1 TRINITY_DN56228_c0_g1~~TRINITY_DN56228_c0_g1_i1.p1  ORF type:complete len:395 (-),score=75.38 TRINITY_DN56228_c0_g1_i1:60-1244(-)
MACLCSNGGGEDESSASSSSDGEHDVERGSRHMKLAENEEESEAGEDEEFHIHHDGGLEPERHGALTLDDLDDVNQAREFMEFGCKCCGPAEHEPVVSKALLCRRPFWSDNFCDDYSFHVSNNHPLLGCFFCSPLHPYSKTERLLVLFVTSMYTIAATCLVNSASSEAGELSGFDLHRVMFLPTLFFVTIPVMLAQVVLEQFSVLDVYLRVDADARCATCRNACADWVLHFQRELFCFVVVGSVGLTFLALVVSGGFSDMADIMTLFWTSRFESWILWFPSDLLMPCCGFAWKWRREKQAWVKRGKARAKDNKFRQREPVHHSTARMVKNEFCGAIVGLFIVGFFFLYLHHLAPETSAYYWSWIWDETSGRINNATNTAYLPDSSQIPNVHDTH